MLSRQDSLLSSSSRRETPTHPPNHRHHHHAAKSIGCMSGIFHLLSKYQNRRKFLTLGKKQEKRDTTNKQREKEESRDVRRRFSCDIVQRSPTIPPDIRRSASVKSPENFRSPMALVPRLMGLQEVPAAGHRPVTEYYYSTSSNSSSNSSEKRRKLMSDIDKCNEDLKELKDIIQTVQFAQHIGRSLPRRPPPAELKRVVNVAKVEGEDDGNVNIPTNNEQPSPVSVLDELTRWPLISTACTRRQTTHGRILPPPQAQKATPRKKPGEDDALDSSFFRKAAVEWLQAKREAAPPWSSKAMVESVEEVCKDIAWGEKREFGRIGLVIHDYICRDLIEEVVKELGFCYTKYSLPLQPCKRRLCF